MYKRGDILLIEDKGFKGSNCMVMFLGESLLLKMRKNESDYPGYKVLILANNIYYLDKVEHGVGKVMVWSVDWVENETRSVKVLRGKHGKI